MRTKKDEILEEQEKPNKPGINLHELLGNMKIDGKKPFRALEEQIWSAIPFWISTGAPSLDMAIAANEHSGGIPHTRVVEIFGMESSGKSSLLDSIIRNFQEQQSGYVLLCDSEHAHEESRMIELGINPHKIVMIEKDRDDESKDVQDVTLEEFFTYTSAAFKAIRKEDADTPILVALDSLAMIDTDIQKAVQEDNRNLKMNETQDKPKIMSSRFGRFASSMVQNNATLIIVNQLREKPGVMFGDPRYTPGGNMLRYIASVRIGVAKDEFIYPKDDIRQYNHEDPVGLSIKFKIVKNKVAAPFRTGIFPLMFDERGIWRDKCIVDMFFNKEIWKRTAKWEKSGAWHSWDGERMGQGQANVLEFLLSNPNIMNEAYNILIQERRGSDE